MKTLERISIWMIAVLFLVLACSCSGKKEEGPRTRAKVNQRAQPSEQEIVEHPKEDSLQSVPAISNWEEAFKFVRDGIKTEPSRFPLKTPEGAVWGRSGNPLEKALLLAQLLQDNGLTVQIAEGELDYQAAAELLESMFPAAKEFSYKKEVPVFRPAEDPNLIAAVRRHFWVQRADGDNWVDLDPSFPRAEPGKAFTSRISTFDPSDDALRTWVSIILEYVGEDSGEPQPVLSWEGLMEDVANAPVSLSIVAEFLKSTEESEEEAEGVGGIFGALGGQRSKKEKGGTLKRVGYNAVLTIRGEEAAEGRILPGKNEIAEIRLKMKFESLGEIISESERIIFERTEANSEIPLFQRHAILIAPNRIPEEVWQDRLKTLSDKAMLDSVKSRVEEIKTSLKAKKIGREVLQKSAELEKKMGPELGFLLTLVFASISDDLTEKEGAAFSVLSYYQLPRILICSFSGDRETSEVAFDLRQDRIEAVPFPGQALSMRRTFHYGRGVMESILEGKLLELLTGRPPLKTALLMREAGRRNLSLRSYSRFEKENLKRIGMPESVAKKIISTLDSGRVVVVPEKPIKWQGQNRWGWWDIDPLTMETIGVLDSGLHQAVLERTILETEGPLETEMGYVIGAMVGAIDTYWVLAAMVLKYGELNKAALEEAKAYLEEINAIMCPEFEAKITLAQLEPEDCFDILGDVLDIETSIEAGVEVSQGWCQNFATGFGCASALILNYYMSQFEE